MEEETNDLEKILPVENGTYVDSTLDSLAIPEMTEKEADEYIEPENVKIEQEGGL